MIGKEKGSMASESLKISKEMTVRADRTIIIQLMSLLKDVDEEDHERTLQGLIDDYNYPNTDYGYPHRSACMIFFIHVFQQRYCLKNNVFIRSGHNFCIGF